MPLPPFEEREEIVVLLERSDRTASSSDSDNIRKDKHSQDNIAKEQKLVNANKELITIFEQKIKEKINSVWGEDKGGEDD